MLNQAGAASLNHTYTYPRPRPLPPPPVAPQDGHDVWIPGKSENMIRDYCERKRKLQDLSAPASFSTSHLIHTDTIQNNNWENENWENENYAKTNTNTNMNTNTNTNTNTTYDIRHTTYANEIRNTRSATEPSSDGEAKFLID